MFCVSGSLQLAANENNSESKRNVFSVKEAHPAITSSISVRWHWPLGARNRGSISCFQTSSVRSSCTAGSANLRRRAGRAWLIFVLWKGVKAWKQHPSEYDSCDCDPQVSSHADLKREKLWHWRNLQDALLRFDALGIASLSETDLELAWHVMISSPIFRPGEVDVWPSHSAGRASVNLPASPPARQQYFLEPLRCDAWPCPKQREKQPDFTSAELTLPPSDSLSA